MVGETTRKTRQELGRTRPPSFEGILRGTVIVNVIIASSTVSAMCMAANEW